MKNDTMPLDLSSVPAETLMEWEAQMRDARKAKPIDKKGAASDVAPGKVKLKLSKKERQLLKKAQKKAAKKDVKALLKARKAEKAKAAKKAAKKHKAKKRKGGKHKKRGMIARSGAAIASGSKKVRRTVVRGFKKVGSGMRYVGRKMWGWAVGSASWAWNGLKFIGRKVAGSAAWAIAAGGKIVSWALTGISTGFVLILVAGILTVVAISWVITGGGEMIVAPLSWLSQGRPGSLKSFKAKRRAKRRAATAKAKAKRAKRAADAKEKAKLKADKAKEKAKLKADVKARVKAEYKATRKSVEARAKKAEKAEKVETVVTLVEKDTTKSKKTKASKKARKQFIKEMAKVITEAAIEDDLEFSEVIDAEVVEIEVVEEAPVTIMEAEAEDNRLRLAVSQCRYDGLTEDDIVRGLFLKLEADRGAPKEAYGTIAGRAYAAKAWFSGLTDSHRGKQLYQVLKAEATKTYGETDLAMHLKDKLARKEINWSSFSKAMDEEMVRLDKVRPQVEPVSSD